MPKIPLPNKPVNALKACSECGAQFGTRYSWSKLCSNTCRQARQKRKYAAARAAKGLAGMPTFAKCAVCGVRFRPNQPNHKLCSDQCRVSSMLDAMARQKLIRAEKSKKPKKDETLVGRYVYGWYFPGEQLPFYVGQGQGNRAWDRHDLGDHTPAFCQRFKTSKTKVVIYRKNLTLEGALLLEAVLVEVFLSLGAILANQAETIKRREVPPLEMPTT